MHAHREDGLDGARTRLGGLERLGHERVDAKAAARSASATRQMQEEVQKWRMKKQQKNIECDPKKKCKLIKLYRKHKRNSKGLLECNICNMSFQKDNTFSMHYKNVHPDPQKEKFKCLHPGCSYESYNKSAVDNHTHPTCPFCNKNLKTISGLYSHISKVCYKNQKGEDESHFKFGKRIYDDFNKNLNSSVKREAPVLVKPKVQRVALIDSDSYSDSYSDSDSDDDCDIYHRVIQQQAAGHSTGEQ